MSKPINKMLVEQKEAIDLLQQVFDAAQTGLVIPYSLVREIEGWLSWALDDD